MESNCNGFLFSQGPNGQLCQLFRLVNKVETGYEHVGNVTLFITISSD